MALELGQDRFAGFTPGALEALEAHPWPGNVRELRNVVERAVYRAASARRPINELQFDPFASPFRPVEPGRAAPEATAPPAPAGRPTDFRAAVASFERQLLTGALAACRHNQRATASHLGLSYDQLRNQLRKHGLLAARR
jgi:psp operon transcriptional activator